MVQILQGKDITLAELIDEFGLQLADDEDFFSEWRHDLPELSDLEKQSLNEVKAEYLHLSKYPILEPVVKMVVLSPLLRLAGFYQPPFYIASEQEVKISSEDEGTIIRGRIDILVLHPPFWVLVIEAKRAEYSLVPAIPQALAYMLADATPAKPVFGFITNGNEFRFIKLTKQGTPRYALSYTLSLNRGDDLHTVVKVLKRLAHLIRNS
ncbi:restriction endonuclease subunit R [Nostoc sp. 'Peltigera membranacea cyanobiont' 213]|uniref:type I restriction enzyme HsdR N-terminal domain-containing protein n=1 Tax=unclassified Nostoc TaxID=2593658 RepID=UPI000B95C343|nr:type I restriction enzyme HsdR N-terminal domain-containing protein [Nostoc sp. 'Peltigera membranacea cyanobiont' 213]OYD92703.1 restriction endonuclease subunit R [Nostoc sp. 'Peltigera membranacea cyanobiont' 213]